MDEITQGKPFKKELQVKPTIDERMDHSDKLRMGMVGVSAMARPQAFPFCLGDASGRSRDVDVVEGERRGLRKDCRGRMVDGSTMILFPPYTPIFLMVSEMRRRARHGLYSGTGTPENMKLIRHCTGEYILDETQCIMIFTRDEGMHSLGMFKNPDYERCFHLSLSFRSNLTGEPIAKDNVLTNLLVGGFFSSEDQKKRVLPANLREKTASSKVTSVSSPMNQKEAPDVAGQEGKRRSHA